MFRPSGACQKSRICRGRVVVSAPLGFGARLDNHGPVLVLPRLHLDSIASNKSIYIIVRISSEPTQNLPYPLQQHNF